MLDWLAFRVMDVAGWLDRGTWGKVREEYHEKWHEWRDITMDETGHWLSVPCRGMLPILVSDGWRPMRYV